jgi:hypothetical protein
MRPEWLSVPAARPFERSARRTPREDAACPVGTPAGSARSAGGAHDLARSRLVIVRVAPFPGPDPVDRSAGRICAREDLVDPAEDGFRGVVFGVEELILRTNPLRTPRRGAPRSLALGRPPSSAVAWPPLTGAEKHRLDVALSMGRQAAERARLAGVRLVIGRVAGPREVVPPLGFERRCPERCGAMRDPYLRLGRLGSVECAALVGMAIAAAQMGVRVCLPGRSGAWSLGCARRLNPGVRHWCVACGVDGFDRDQSVSRSARRFIAREPSCA